MRGKTLSAFAAFLVALVLSFARSGLADEGMETASAEPGQSDTMKDMGAHMRMGAHMSMTDSRPVIAEDTKHFQQLLKTMRDSLARYKDSNVAAADGYKPFMPTVPQDIYHFANRSVTGAEYMGDFDPKRPGSLLYRKKVFGGWELVGAMYSAPPDATPSQLDSFIPLSLGHWHAHTNICIPKGVTVADVMNGNVHAGAHTAGMIDPDPERNPSNMGMPHNSGRNTSAKMRMGYVASAKFGFDGGIATEPECQTAGGEFHKQIFGWMIHVYPFVSDDPKVALSMDAP